MATADGVSIVKNAEELRVKESDRISTVLEGLNRCGVETKEFSDGYEIKGGELKSATINSYGDHRVAMSFATSWSCSRYKYRGYRLYKYLFSKFFRYIERDYRY